MTLQWKEYLLTRSLAVLAVVSYLQFLTMLIVKKYHKIIMHTTANKLTTGPSKQSIPSLCHYVSHLFLLCILNWRRIKKSLSVGFCDLWKITPFGCQLIIFIFAETKRKQTKQNPSPRYSYFCSGCLIACLLYAGSFRFCLPARFSS